MNEDVERVLSSGRRSNRSVLGEQSRVYRSVINGKLDPVEGTRLVFMLKEIRCTLEAVATAAAAAPPPPKGDVNIIIRPIERGSMFNANGQLVTSEEAAAERALPPLLELAAQPEPEPVPVAQYEPRHLLSSTKFSNPDGVRLSQAADLVLRQDPSRPVSLVGGQISHAKHLKGNSVTKCAHSYTSKEQQRRPRRGQKCSMLHF